ncbi:hypothetical protein ACNFJ7_02125 [Sphingomonas sp. HT-1]|uniref:hypothetical protein n=1 Tax=unclassified Sphingomonas TaxID=196159 RepID=UPI0002E121BE|nr:MULTISPECIES: hypothetical protein [unclassified Sphingomonas]KTF68667.1 hypothetical protein ATB93_13155 [Sphingomonas sp. WG]
MSADLLARLIAAGTPADLVGEVAMALATAQAQAQAATQPTKGALRMRRYRERHEASPSVTCDASDAQVTHSDADPSPNKSPPDPQKLTPTPHTHEGPAPDAPATARAWACPAGVDPEHWRDFRANRRKKRLTDTDTAYRGQLKLLAQFATAEWPPGRLVEKAAEKGWGTIVDPSEYEDQSNGHRPANHRRNRDRNGSNGLLDAVIDAERQERFGARH